MNNFSISSLGRFFVLIILQVTILKSITNELPYVSVYVYPLFLLMLPFRTPPWIQLILGFLIGLSIDLFYNTMGLHTSISVLTAFLRPYLANVMEPRGGYDVEVPAKATMGIGWFLQYSGILMFFHLFFLFTLEALTITPQVLLKLITSYVVSMIFVILYQYLFNPRH